MSALSFIALAAAYSFGLTLLTPKGDGTLPHMATILVVEDEPIIREVVCDILKASHTCRAVRTAEEGLELLAAEAFDVVVTDVKLPEMDGHEFMLRAHELHPRLPVIVISGGYGYDDRRFLDAGAFGYLLKPFRADELEELVARAAGG